MTTIVKNALKGRVGEVIFNEVLTNVSRYYYYLGRILTWDGMDTPEVPLDTFKYELETRNNIVAVKQIGLSDMAAVSRRINWVSGVVYAMYDDTVSALETTDFYVLTDEFNVYKCIFNNNGAPSTSKPTGNDSESQPYADGYIWKFMFNSPVALRNKFLTSSVMPVLTALTNQFYSNGEINTIIIENPGSGYTTATITVTGNGYIENNPYMITNITITDPGSGYTVNPIVTISTPSVISGSELQATATASHTAGAITTATLTEDGYGYEANVTVTIGAPFVGTQFIPSTSYTNGVYVFWERNYYLVVGTGLSGATPPTHTTGTVASGAISLTFAGEQAVVALTTVKTEAQITAILSGGEIINYTVVDSGVGYTFASIEVTGDGTGAVLTPNLSVGDLNSLQSSVELQAVNGSIEAIQVTNSGVDYGAASVVIAGDGTGAAATAVINMGEIEKILMTNIGEGYTFATVTITGNGTGATARAIMSPLGGHGKNAINELLPTSLMIYSNISNEKNLGVANTNDYRQSGIVKNINKYNDPTKFRSVNGSACFKIASTINPLLFPKDSVVFQVSNNKQFLVVDVAATYILLQSIENETPLIGLDYRNANMDIFTAGIVTLPTIDKFSGDLLYIDNRSGFAPDINQAVAFRTIIGLS